MNHPNGKTPILSWMLGVSLLCILPATAQDTFPAQPGKDWPIYGGSYNNQRYSSLREITAVNAINLQAKWTYHVEGMHGLESVPVVANGVMYIMTISRNSPVMERPHTRNCCSCSRWASTALSSLPTWLD